MIFIDFQNEWKAKYTVKDRIIENYFEYINYQLNWSKSYLRSAGKHPDTSLVIYTTMPYAS